MCSICINAPGGLNRCRASRAAAASSAGVLAAVFAVLLSFTAVVADPLESVVELVKYQLLLISK